MNKIKCKLFFLLVVAFALSISPGSRLFAQTFKPTDESFRQYQYPEWFRDAKFGIWAHWGPQAVPRQGDWYAKKLYEEGGADYKYHVEHYGHPSKFGYKDIIPLWKAERWDPEKLMALYKKVGAKYFVSMGTHHDNFFLWNSKIHKWNAVNMGPKKDVVGLWQKAAKKEGLRFGVSEHLGASYTWFQTSRKADKSGPMAGVPYDGANPEFEELYHPMTAPDDKAWLTTSPETFINPIFSIPIANSRLAKLDAPCWPISIIRTRQKTGENLRQYIIVSYVHLKVAGFRISSGAQWIRSARIPGKPIPLLATGITGQARNI
jgi:hypothetical protein